MVHNQQGDAIIMITPLHEFRHLES